MQPSHSSEDFPGLEGPDYLALVIEWNDEDEEDEEDVATLVTREIRREPASRAGTIRTIAAVVGALGALLFAAWGIRRLRAA
jgi:hypothetical protein